MTKQTNLSLLPLFKAGLELTKKNFTQYLPLLIGSFLIVYLGNEFLTDFLLERNPDALQFDLLVKSSAIIGLIISPIEVGLMLLGLSAARGEVVRIGDMKYVLAQSAQIILLTILSVALIQVGFMLFLLPGLFLMIVLSMAPMLMCDQRINLFAALKVSTLTLSKHWLALLVIYLWLISAIILSFFTMGIALMFTLPLYVNVKGLVYRELFDQPIAENMQSPSHHNDFGA